MTTAHNTVDSALGSIRSDPWPGADRPPPFQELIMTEALKHSAARRRSRRVAAAVGIGAAVVGGTVFAASGGPAAVRAMFRGQVVTEDGTVLEFEGVADGVATVQTPDGRTVTIRSISGSDGQIQLNATVDAPAGASPVLVPVSPAGAE
jgi:hypothetical protein